MPNLTFAFVLAAAVLVAAQEPPALAGRFAGTWVGTQSWAIPDPPPGARQDQPVTLTLDVVDGRLSGTMRPFMGTDDGATITDVKIVGEELQATAILGRPRTPGQRGGRQAWAEPVQIAFVFRNDGVALAGTADVKMGDTPWAKFRYQLEKKRARY